MNKKDFLSILANGLKDFPEKELADILFDYQEHFTIGKSNGKTEEEIINELGNPYEIVYQYRCAYLEKTSYDTQDTLNLDKDDTKFYCDVNYEDVYTDTNGYDSNSYSNSDINSDYNSNKHDESSTSTNDTMDNNNTRNKSWFAKNFAFGSMGPLKIILIILAFIFFSPFILALGATGVGLLFGIIGIFIGIIGGCFGLSISGIAIMLSKLGLVVLGASETPQFIIDFPNSVIVLFIIGSLALTILLCMLTYYFIKWIVISIINLFKKIRKGGN